MVMVVVLVGGLKGGGGRIIRRFNFDVVGAGLAVSLGISFIIWVKETEEFRFFEVFSLKNGDF